MLGALVDALMLATADAPIVFAVAQLVVAVYPVWVKLVVGNVHAVL